MHEIGKWSRKKYTQRNTNLSDGERVLLQESASVLVYVYVSEKI